MAKTIATYSIILIMSLSIFNCKNKPKNNPEEEIKTENEEKNQKIDEISHIVPVKNYKDLVGTWKLLYRGSYGYEFKFYNSYKTIVIVYLNNQSIIFKGVCVLDENSNMQINIYETKNSKRVKGLNLYSGFKKRKSSYLVFNSSIYITNRRKRLFLKHIKTIIDGSDSEGYFEPSMKLKKI